MNEQTQPTDAELASFTDAFDWEGWISPALAKRAFARAVLAKWGTPAGAGEPAGRVVSANCQYATVEWLQQTSEVGGGDPDNSRSWPITGDAVYLTPQPTQAQAGAVPLTVDEVEQLIAQWSYEVHGDRARYLVRMTEQHHGITAHGVADMKGGQDGPASPPVL